MTDQPKDCQRCGQPHERCTAHNRAGQPCRRWPEPDQRVCKHHGGRTPRAVAAAEVRRAEREALVAAETFGLPREVDPHTALLEELHRTAGAVGWLSAVVADLERHELEWTRVRSKTGGEDHGTTHEARPSVYVDLWQRERKHLVEVSRACISAGIEERRVRVAEEAGRQLASVIRAVLDRLELTDAQRSLALTVVPEEFRRMAEVVPGEVVA